MKDYYQILGVPENAGQQAIKSTFRKLAFRHHPDTNPGQEKEAEEKFKEVNEAYAILGDKARRQQYDYARKAGFASAGYQAFSYSQQDIFRNIFSNQATLDELNRMFAQSGLRFDRDFLNQVFFSGRGTAFQFYTHPGSSTFNQRQPSGSNAVPYRPNWLERMLSKMLAKLSRLLLKRLLGIEYRPKLDLHTELKITPSEAAAGGEREVSYQRGRRKKKLMVKMPPRVRQGTRIRLRGMGLTEKKRAGDLYLHIKIRDEASLGQNH